MTKGRVSHVYIVALSGMIAFAIFGVCIAVLAESEARPALAPAAPVNPWLTYLNNPARTSASSASVGAQLELRWIHPVSGLVASEPVLADGRVYVGAWD